MSHGHKRPAIFRHAYIEALGEVPTAHFNLVPSARKHGFLARLQVPCGYYGRQCRTLLSHIE